MQGSSQENIKEGVVLRSKHSCGGFSDHINEILAPESPPPLYHTSMQCYFLFLRFAIIQTSLSHDQSYLLFKWNILNYIQHHWHSQPDHITL